MGNIIVGAIVILIIAAAVTSLYKKHKSGGS